MTIGELARQAGVGVETVRYYQRRGLFPEPPRQARRTREYAPDALDLLRFIRRARGLSFTIKEIEGLLLLRRSSRKDPRELSAILTSKAAELEQQVRDTHGVIRVLNEMVERCEREPSVTWRLFDGQDAQDAQDAQGEVPYPSVSAHTARSAKKSAL